MPGNCGATSLRRRRRALNPMGDYDRLPRELRLWVASATLPWRAKSVRDAYEKALARTGTSDAALAELTRLQTTLVAKDAARIWGDTHPEAQRSRHV
ncbi:MAG: DUF6525 family protein [Paracoccaceae bacterium]